jgi:hypothetical protein
VLTAIALGFALGLRHAFDPDHVIAVSTLVARHRSPWTATWVGMSWGIGHSATILAAGALMIAARVAIPAGLTRSAEAGVGVLLLALGAANLAAAAGTATPEPAGLAGEGPPLRTSLARSGITGLLHGLAGSGAVALLATAAMPAPAAAIVYLLVFALGSVAGMVAFSLLLGAPLVALGEEASWRRGLTALTGLVSLAFGAHLLHRLGWLSGWLS